MERFQVKLVTYIISRFDELTGEYRCFPRENNPDPADDCDNEDAGDGDDDDDDGGTNRKVSGWNGGEIYVYFICSSHLIFHTIDSDFIGSVWRI